MNLLSLWNPPKPTDPKPTLVHDLDFGKLTPAQVRQRERKQEWERKAYEARKRNEQTP
jgi:hypothetical protein